MTSGLQVQFVNHSANLMPTPINSSFYSVFNNDIIVEPQAGAATMRCLANAINKRAHYFSPIVPKAGPSWKNRSLETRLSKISKLVCCSYCVWDCLRCVIPTLD